MRSDVDAIELGCGERHLAVERILDAVMSNRMMLPVARFDWLARWLDRYARSPDEPQLTEIRAQQFRPVPLRTQQAQRADVRRTAARACSTSVAR
jgi:hypothetical protein